MKQGKASVSGPADRKVEPQGKYINPGAVSRLGTKMGNHADNKDMTLRPTPWSSGPTVKGSSPRYAGQGPGAGRTIRPSGSQGKH